MKKSIFVTGLLVATVTLQGCSDTSSSSPLLAALAEQQDSAEGKGSVIIDFGDVYADYDEFIIVCQEDFREMALQHAGLADDSIDPLGDSESAVVAYSSGNDSEVFTDVVDQSDVTLCEGVQSSAIPITQNQQPFSYSDEDRSEAGSPWLRQGTDAALY